MSKARGFLAKAKRCEERARKVRDILASAYRMLAEAEKRSYQATPKNGRLEIAAAE